MAIIYPSLENISRLKVKPTEGELWIVNYLNENLDESYEVFFNPFLDGDRPDIIILKKDVAIFVIEVKDYDLKNYNVDSFNKWSVVSHQGSNPISSPQSQAFTYKNNLYQLHLPVLGLGYLSNRYFFNLVQPLVYFHKANKFQINELYKNAENENRESARLLFEQKKSIKSNLNNTIEKLMALIQARRS
ncbi:nuclease-related domain-containing protein [Photobacterium leiognathi]|uniref:nuclease-related domain-containing protein n=1 Tax=Photobacterium leiognathi TaxID=553611 RepID=UPI002980CF1F|nr:nuclease-related domain-containing protein [Photobacterium leiognathi]